MAATIPQYHTVQDLAKELGLQVNQAKNLVTNYSMVEGVICPRGSNNDLLISQGAFEDIVNLQRESKTQKMHYTTLLTIRQAARRQQLEQQLVDLMAGMTKAMDLLVVTTNTLQDKIDKVEKLQVDQGLTMVSLASLCETAAALRKNQEGSQELLAAAQQVSNKTLEHLDTAKLIAGHLERFRSLLNQEYKERKDRHSKERHQG